MKFTKYNNPSKKRKIRRKHDYTTASQIVLDDMIRDMRNGNEMSIDCYNNRINRMTGQKEEW